MNNLFAEATTGVAFVLTLSKRQCNTLLRLKSHEAIHGKPQRVNADNMRDGSWDINAPAYIGIVQTDTLRPLRDRVLVFWFTDLQGKPHGFGGLTKAGMTIENTNTLSVLRRMDRAA